MAALNLTIPIPKEASQFEDLVFDYAEDKLSPEAIQQYGKRGSGQSGIDHQVRLVGGDWVGIQCKRYWDAKLTPTLLQKDLDAAHALQPALTRYIVATTKSTQTDLQDWARSATIHAQARVDIWFWEDIERWILVPTNLVQYLPLPPAVLAESLSIQLGNAKGSREIMAFCGHGD
ncbi:MAG: hypothetical protein P4L92_00145 [Rudaea sp.]|nr:hypothetical protein [Rudaea sp.]